MSVNTPKDVIESAVNIGRSKIALSSGNYGKFAVLAMLAGVYIAFGGILSLTIGFGFPEITANNPSLQKLLSGCMFPIGLILVVLLGAELFTGNIKIELLSITSSITFSKHVLNIFLTSLSL